MFLLPVLASLLPLSLGMPVDGPDAQRRDLHAWLSVAKEGDTLSSGGALYQLVTPHDSSLAKRQGTGSCPNAEYRVTEVESTEQGWSGYAPRHCFDCSGSEGSCTFAESVGWETSYTISFGLDASAAGQVASDITGNSGLNFGYEWTQSFSGSATANCEYPGGTYGRFLVQTKIGIANTRSRLCRSSCINEHCDEWEYGRVEYPLKDENGLAIDGTKCETVDTNEACHAGI
ncbi:hypothetical protein A1Q2_01727 [Trichosporon asahii var. asahii CBS 8904]|uniref:Uncharacterized protein n=1 Tax=Trichosporon asahii var. asahii (strain CBS 8904) TaxID=1220162 RepID=K1VWW4_TRIAC|nr:hypothetical protein A1Q2_01727 [Trichosporon asahii var. asahii CBS 8904]